MEKAKAIVMFIIEVFMLLGLSRMAVKSVDSDILVILLITISLTVSLWVKLVMKVIDRRDERGI